MIDWANLIAGVVLGFLPGLALWMVDRSRGKRQRRADALTAWAVAAKELELAALRPGATSGDLYLARVRHPIDLWRSILGPEDFRRWERVEGSFQAVETWSRRIQDGTGDGQDEERLVRALEERRTALAAFANVSRMMQSVSYDDVIDAEERRRVRRDYLRRPIKTWRRERHNARMRREAGMPTRRQRR